MWDVIKKFIIALYKKNMKCDKKFIIALYKKSIRCDKKNIIALNVRCDKKVYNCSI